MPYPILAVAGLALSAAGTAAQMNAQGQAQSAVERAKAAELARQAEYQRKASGVVADSLAKSGREGADVEIDAGAAKRLAQYDRLGAGKQSATIQPVTQNRTVTGPTATATANTNAQVQAWNRILGGAQSRAAGYEDWGLNQKIKNSRAGEQLAMIGTDARGSAGVNQLELEKASNAGQGMAQIGNLLGATGSVLGMYGATQPGTRLPSATQAGAGGPPAEAMMGSNFQVTPVGSAPALTAQQRYQINAWNSIFQ